MCWITSTTLAKKNRHSREIHEVDLQFDHVISCDIELRFDVDATCGIQVSAHCEHALQIEVDVAWYQMIALRIDLMNISAVTIFFGQGSITGGFWLVCFSRQFVAIAHIRFIIFMPPETARFILLMSRCEKLFSPRWVFFKTFSLCYHSLNWIKSKKLQNSLFLRW